MPVIGTVRYGEEIGKRRYIKYQWLACEGCGTERWVVVIGGKPECRICQVCNRKLFTKGAYFK